MQTEDTQQPKHNERKPGYYRVKPKNGPWQISEWATVIWESEMGWYECGSRLVIFGDQKWTDIDETPISAEPEKKEERNTRN